MINPQKKPDINPNLKRDTSSPRADPQPAQPIPPSPLIRNRKANSYNQLIPDTASTGYQFAHSKNGDPLTDLYRLVHETAIELTIATTSPSEWPPLIIYLLRSLEAQAPTAASLESALDDICRLITRRMNTGEW